MTALIICLVFCIVMYLHVQKYEEQKSELHFSEIQEIVRRMYRLTEQIDSIENMISDIEICSADHVKAVKIEIPDSLSQNASHEMLINGNDISSQYLLQLALAERDRLRTSLLDEAEKISRSVGTQRGTQTIVKTKGE